MDYYEILGVEKEASAQDIKKAFRQIARECHPDVTGDDPVAEERFKAARKAYETLIDPVTRGRYDRRGQRKFTGGSFFDAFYRHTGGQTDADAPGKGPPPPKPRTYGTHDAGGSPGAGRKARHNPGNDLDLEDLFNGFGDFGFGQNGGPKAASGSKRSAPPPPGASSAPPRDPTPERGEDVEIELEVDARTARDGGTVTAVYNRQQRSSTWRPASGESGVARVQDIADIRIIPGTSSGEVLREKGLGDAGAFGGPYGDLIVRVRVVGARHRPSPPPPDRFDFDPPSQEEPRASHRAKAEVHRTPPPPPPRTPPPAEEPQKSEPIATMDVDISVAEALLGGRVPLETPQGRVRIAIPPGTSSGARMRLKGKGASGEDLFVVIRIVVPKDLDEESRRLIEEFARLNPGLPRD